jgi:hypothetical protein
VTNKELLELAAKAAGVVGDLIGNDIVIKDGTSLYFWNPLTDDGDALRLAVKLNIDIVFWPDNYVQCCYPGEPADAGDLTEPYNNDHYAATRRAIVRAAAEIGKEMK